MYSSRVAVRSAFVIVTLLCVHVGASSQWVAQPVPSWHSVLLSVGFSSANVGVTGGYAVQNNVTLGGAVYTTNGGTTWEPAHVPDSARALVSVRMFGDGTGYYAGAYNVPTMVHKAFAAIDAPPVTRSGASLRAARLHRIGMNGWDVYRGLFLKTSDGGQSWTSWGTLPDSTYYVVGMSFLDAGTGFVTTSVTPWVERAGILKTTDGGTSWARCPVADSVAHLASIRFVDSTLGFSVGYRRSDSVFTGVILRTTDGGVSWTSTVYPTVDNFTDVWCPDAVTAYASGVTSSGDGVMYRTGDGGVNWAPVMIAPDSTFFQGVCFSPGGQAGFVYGLTFKTPAWAAYASRSTDGGGQWKPTVFPDAGEVYLTGGTLLDDNNAYLVGGNPYGQAAVFHTTNGGVTFVPGMGGDHVEVSVLVQNFPNPFNPATTIRYVLHDRAYVTLTVCNTLGQQVAVLQEGEQGAGHQEVRFNAAGLPSGMYVYRIQVRPLDVVLGTGTGSFTATGKCLLMR